MNRMFQGKAALVTSIGSVSGDVVIKSLKRYGMKVIGCDIYPKEYVVDAYHVDVFYQVPLSADRENYLKTIYDICSQNHVEYVLPLTDIDVDTFNDNRSWFADHGVTLCMSPEQSLHIIRNKKTLQDFIAENCPQNQSIPTMRLCDMEENPWGYPVVCKPYNGRSSQGLRYIHSDAEWVSFKQTADNTQYIAEPYLAGPIVMVEIVRHAGTGKTVAIPRMELIATPHGCGTTVRMFHDEKLEQDSIALARNLDIHGCVNFEYIQTADGTYHLVECNPRFSAGVEFSCMTGYDCILNHLRSFTEHDIADGKTGSEMIIARKYEEYITAM